ncbi:MAG: efflux RND transporter permease subunit [bacterium]|nr:efflux RND transporter permease subunit [bacterium]
MTNLTKYVLRHPITTILCVLCLIVFGISSLTGSKLELTPDMEMPMMVISTVYPGASPEDVNELVTKPIEEATGVLSGIDSTTSYSQENVSMVLLQYEYGSDMDQAYSDLKKKIDGLNNTLPDDAQEPTIMEFNINEQAAITLSVKNPNAQNLYNFVINTLQPEFEKISSVASVDISGGEKEYIRVEILPDKLQQYHLSISNIAQMVAAADFNYPAGTTVVGKQELSVSAGSTYDSMESLKNVIIPMGNGNLIHLEDLANIYMAKESDNGISRYDGEDTITLAIKKQQSASAVEVSEEVHKTMDEMMAEHSGLDIMVVEDSSEMITSSLKTVFETMIMAVIISMVIIFLFFGDIKASLIVGTSIPVSILTALCLMYVMGFSLNVITMSSLVLGVGMMVDNSIVVLESCFRSTTKKGFLAYREAALKGTGIVSRSIFGSTVTTCVVFVPMAVMQGISGQLFRPLGYTIVFCMAASLVSAMTIVPLCYAFYRPEEKEAPLSGPVAWMQKKYRSLMEPILKHKGMVIVVTVVLLVISLLMATKLKMEMMPETDEGTIQASIELKPGLTNERVNEILLEAESYISSDENVESYMLSYGGSGLSLSGSGASITAYLKDDRSMETDEVVELWKPVLGSMTDCSITVTSLNSMSMMSTNTDYYEVILQSAQYEDAKAVSDRLVEELRGRSDVTQVHSSLENAAPVVKLEIDPIKTAAEGLTPIAVATSVNGILSGTEAMTMDVNGEEVSVMVEYGPEEYDTLEKVKSILLPTTTGASVALTDIAEVRFEDSPQAIQRVDKQYQVTVTANYTDTATANTKAELDTLVSEQYLGGGITLAENAMTEMMYEEFGNLFNAILIAVFLIFVVMAAQFESPKFSIMVMTTIPFSLIGAFSFLFYTDVSISMPSLLGFLMLVGNVVNNGILYVDTVNQYRETMDLKTALIEAGATRLRPILMTTLTTVISMVPMAVGYGDSGAMMQGLALVNVGGLTASTVMALLLLPAFYALLNRKPKPELELD